MSCWTAINLALDKVLSVYAPTPHVEVLVIALNEKTLPNFREHVTKHVSPVAPARFNYLTASKLTAANVRGRTRLMIIKEVGVQVPSSIELSLVHSLVSASRCFDIKSEDLIFTV